MLLSRIIIKAFKKWYNISRDVVTYVQRYVVGKIKEILKIVIAESCCCKFNFSLHCDVNGNHLVDPFQTHIEPF